MLLRVAVVIDAEATPNTVQEHPRKRGRQTRMMLLAQCQGWPEIHEPAGMRLDGEKDLRTVRLILGFAPFMRVRG